LSTMKGWPLFRFSSIYLFMAGAVTAGCFADGPLDLQSELVSGQDLPGVEEFWWGLGGVKANRSGDIAFLTSLLPTLRSGGDYGIFLKRAGTITRVLVEGDQLPDSAGIFSIEQNFIPAFDLNDNGTVVVVIPSGVLLKDSAGLRWVVRSGATVAGTSLTLSTFLGTALSYSYEDDRWDALRPFLNEENVVLFKGQLSDGRTGVFRSSPSTGVIPVMLNGDSVPGRPGLVFNNVEYAHLKLLGDHLLLLCPDMKRLRESTHTRQGSSARF